MGFVLVLGGRHLGGLSAATASDSLEGHLARARECMSRRAWDAPAGDNVKEVTAQALARWPSDPRVAELRREASERIVADALGRKYAGDPAGALRLAELALELTPSLTTAQHLAAELRAISPTPAGEPPLEVAPALSGAGDPTRRPPLRRGPQDGRPTPPGGQPAPPPTTASKAGSAPAPGSGAAPAPELPPTPPPLPPEPPAALPTASGPWL
jgi:serine/threonine-protein kinase